MDEVGRQMVDARVWLDAKSIRSFRRTSAMSLRRTYLATLVKFVMNFGLILTSEIVCALKNGDGSSTSLV